MTPDDLAAIRARSVGFLAYVTNETVDAYRDLMALLAEVDRLTAMHPYGSQQEIGAAFAVMDERARILAAVGELTIPTIEPPSPGAQRWYSEGYFRAVRDVLAAIKGETT